MATAMVGNKTQSMIAPKPAVLVFADYYYPSQSAGGPLRSLTYLFQSLNEYFDFYVLTRNSEYGTAQIYDRIQPHQWYPLDGVTVYYIPQDEIKSMLVRTIVRQKNICAYYCNSLFSYHFSIRIVWWRHRGKIPNLPLMIAPRGELSPGGIQLKWWKKKPFLWMMRHGHYYRSIVWHATSALEKEHCQQTLSTTQSVIEAPNLLGAPPVTINPVSKTSGQLYLLFVSRVVRKKNLLGALEILRMVRGDVHFHILGDCSDHRYVAQCKKKLAQLPANIQVHFHGTIAPQHIMEWYMRHHALLLPTLGENFGYSIVESLLCGRPVIISDQTPWSDVMPHNAGWALPLSDQKQFTAAVQELVDMDNITYAEKVKSVQRYITNRTANTHNIQRARQLFHHLIEHNYAE